MSTKTIYDQLRSYGLTAEGACGLMGNFQAESAMRSNNVEDRSGMDDERYTALADSGSYDFLTDYGKHYGYGLAQWTLSSRKENLLNMAKKRGVSVSDETMQVDFAIWELSNQFPGVWQILTTSHDLYECSRIVCVQYELPAVNNVDVRYRYARDFFAQQAGGSDSDPAPAPQPVASRVDFTVAVIQFLMQFNDQSIWPYEIDGIKSKKFFDALREFTDAMEGC